MIVYGSAIYTILKYDKLINGAKAEVSKKRNAAWPFGVAILGILVPTLIAIAKLLNWSVPTGIFSATWPIYIVATNTSVSYTHLRAHET